jgi:hypothetical protein
VQGDDLFYNNNKRGGKAWQCTAFTAVFYHLSLPERAFAHLTIKDGTIRCLSPAECPQNIAQQAGDPVKSDFLSRPVTTFLKWDSIVRGDLRPGITKIEESEVEETGSDTAGLDRSTIKDEWLLFSPSDNVS